MAYTVTIVYKKPEAPVEGKFLPISSLFEPTGSYVDSEAYEGTIYDTNVPGWGSVPDTEYYAHTHVPFPTPLAQLNMPTSLAEYDAEEGTWTSEFVVDDFETAAYYSQLGTDMADQGFTVTVEEVTEDGEG